MSKKINRNAPCPCGSGKKYKKCCLRTDPGNEKHNPHAMLEEVSDWVLKEPELKDEFEEVLDLYYQDDDSAPDVANILDAYIFDYQLHDGKTPFEHFLDNAGISPSDRAIYEKLDANVFSIFEVLEVFRGQGLKLMDLLWNREYFVREKMGTLQIECGHILFCRIASFDSTYIVITPSIHAWPREAGYSIKRKLRYISSDEEKRKIDAFAILDLLSTPESRLDDLDSVKRSLKRKLNSLGIRIDFRGLGRRINENESITEAFPEIYEHSYPSNDDVIETTKLLQTLWNKHPRKKFDGKSPEDVSTMGPIEKSLISDLMDEAMNNVDPDEYPSVEDAQNAIEIFKEAWLKTPQKELDGKTPFDAIMEERAELGIPKEGFNYQVQLSGIQDFDENEAERLYSEGVEAFKMGAVGKAAELFEEVTVLFPGNYKAWGNLGNSYAYLGIKNEAVKCYEKALSIEPDYEFARKNLGVIHDQTEKDLATMGMLGAMQSMINKSDKSKEREDINVWDDTFEEMRKTGKRKKDE